VGHAQASSPREPSASRLAAQGMVQMAGLVGQEFALAKAELRAQSRQLGIGGSLVAGAGFLGVSAWLVMLAAAVAGIAVVLPVWAAALIVGGALGLGGGAIAVFGGRRLARAMPPLPITTESVRRDLREIKEMARSDGKP
jgi:predicted tellurium resistance membrane protein TerC